MAAEAKQAMAGSRFGRAAELYSQLLPLAPENIGMLANLGMALHLSGQDAEALEPLSKVVARDATVFPAQLFLGLSFLRLGEIEKGVGPLEQAAKLDPKHTGVRQTLGDAYTQMGRPSQALPHRLKLTQLAADVPSSWALLAMTYDQLAQQSFERLQDAAPESPYVLRLLADMRFSQQQYPSAYFLYREALDRKPGWRGLHAVIAAIYSRTEHSDWAEAEQQNEAALGDIDCEAERFECLYAQSKLQELQVLTADLATPEGLYWQTQVFNRLASQAFEHLEQMPPSAELHATLAQAYRDRLRHKEAAEQWTAALRLDPKNPDLAAELTISLYQSRQFEAAEPRLRELVGKEPEFANWRFMLGDILLSRQNVEQALPFLERAVDLDANLLPAHHALGRVYMQLGEDAKAVPHLKLALPLDQDGSLHYQLARAYQTLGDREAARPLLQKYQAMQRAQREQQAETLEEVRITAPDEAP